MEEKGGETPKTGKRRCKAGRFGKRGIWYGKKRGWKS